VLQCVAVDDKLKLSVLQSIIVCCSVLQCVAVCCSVLQCVAACCSVLQCVAVFYLLKLSVHVADVVERIEHHKYLNVCMNVYT